MHVSGFKMAKVLVRNAILRTVIILAGNLAENIRKKKQRRKRIWVRDWISRREKQGVSNNLLQELKLEDPRDYKIFLRMSEQQFEYLLEKVKGKISKKDTAMREALSPQLKLEIVLRYLATGDSFKSLEYLYRVPKCTISVFLVDVLEAIYQVLEEYVKVPTTENEWRRIEQGFATKWNFPTCVGALDGKHIVIKNPSNAGSDYYNYKGTYSIVLLALVDADYCFTYIDVGAQGRASDGGTFQESALYDSLENSKLNMPSGMVIVADDAFPLKTYLMKPFSKRNLSLRERIFNYRLSRARRIVENAFGILVSVFRIFERPIALSPEKVTSVVKATTALHNWLRKTSAATYIKPGLVDTEDLETGQTTPGSWRNLPSALHTLQHQAADILVDFGFVQVLLNNLDDTCKIVELHLKTLDSLFYCDAKQLAIEEDGFEALHKLLERDEGKILALACSCLANLCSINAGRKLAQQMKILPQLNSLLHDERVDVHTAAAKAIMFCTIISDEKKTASQIKGLPKRLVQLCRNKLRPNCQMYAIKALTCICEHPLIRQEVSEKYYHDLVNIQLSESIPDMKSYKNTLMSMLQWVPHANE